MDSISRDPDPQPSHKTFAILSVVAILAQIIAWGAIAYVAWHFISKFW